MPDTSAPALVAENLVFGYGGKRAPRILDGVSLSIRPGALTVLTGPNASGKSTLIKCLAGVHRAASGQVRIGGDPVSGLSAGAIARRLAYAPQSVPVPFAFTVAELLDLNPNAGMDRTGARAALLAEFDLDGMAGRSLLSLSGGERQRAISARAFGQNTPVLLLDEPTAHLDLRHQVSLMEAARRRARQGASVCIVLHDLNLAAAFADTVVLLSRGVVAAQGSVTEVVQLPILHAVYDAPVQVIMGPGGRPVVLPASPL